ncbi:NAD(P)/FAD-dependent oxidoreductase [Ottowia testudinis]|uniref:Ferredoxin--NADP reductase n=1 Tax=Ottowia testudinis TaxID=2816950 RepID=A0A975H526_9BURK|nr:NAD(P)/FAD-dependent oxidoreductase [Ottowia testudinis]QTD46995.1 NAD(P)/FAD-dependent oxidoreductase [Ottowia testudinis]
MTPDTTAIEADAVIIGAGPVGLFAVFELGLLEIDAHVIDALPQPGGQPGELYPGKPIYDIPGIPVCSGQQLIDGLMRQIAPFQPRLHLGHQVSTLQQQDDGRFLVETHKGLRLRAKTVFIAAGVGAFVPKRLTTPGIDAFEDRQLFYSVADAARFAGQRLVIVGGGDSALDWAIHFATQADQAPASVTLLHRRDGFQAAPASVARLRALCEAGQMRLVIGQVDGFEQQGERLTALQVMGPDGETQPLPLDALLVFHGMSPKLGPIADWQLALERRQLVVDTEKFQTSEPGIFAIGDINTYPGKRKLILCGFHEATLAAYAAQALIAPDKNLPFQYTTSSTRLQRLLNVDSANPR